MSPDELEQAIQDAFDGVLDDERAAELRDALKASPEALDLYCRHAVLDAGLRRYVAGHNRMEEGVEESAPLSKPSAKRRQLPVSLLATAAIVVLSAVILSLIRVRTENSGPFAQIETCRGSRVFTQGGASLQDANLSKDEAVTLGQGVARLKLRSGVEAVIEGPATFSLKTRNTMELASGRAWFHVPPDARGFKVTSPSFEVVDLGTEFGIDQREDIDPEISLLKGKIEVRALIGARQEVQLTVGQTVKLGDDGRWTPVPSDANPGNYRSSLPQSLPELKMDFEQIDQDTLSIHGDLLGVDESQARLIHPELVRLVPGVSGKAIEFKGDGAYIETTWQGISGTAPRTVSLWCRIPKGVKQQTAPPLTWWGNPARGSNRKFKIALFTDSAGRTVLRSSFGNHISDGTTPLADGEWHHLAVVYRGNDPSGSPDLAFYVDGRPETRNLTMTDPAPIETETGSDRSGTFALGRYELPGNGRNPYLTATLDELRIFAGALDEQAVRSLAERH
ncbi:MAG: FecR domain-containing protein [Luteolibacter sp.]